LLGVQSGRHWPSVARAIGRPDLVDDPRFAQAGDLLRNRAEAMALMDDAFATRRLVEWEEVFGREDGRYERVQSPEEAIDDPGLIEAGAFRPTEDGDRTVATPVEFSSLEPGPAARATESGVHTELVLLELGWTWEEMSALRDPGVIP
jgi:crotonobetainyl-CoA:carnitine CoA-transferase CaiB-like acyl-CoA transferase